MPPTRRFASRPMPPPREPRTLRERVAAEAKRQQYPKVLLRSSWLYSPSEVEFHGVWPWTVALTTASDRVLKQLMQQLQAAP